MQNVSESLYSLYVWLLIVMITSDSGFKFVIYLKCTFILKLAATLRGSRPGVQSASLYDNFGKPGNYVIMTS